MDGAVRALIHRGVAECALGGNPSTRLIAGRAQEVLTRLTEESYDLVFIDADKEWYTNYAKAVLPKLVAGGALYSVDLKSGEMRLPAGADVPAITRAIQRAGFGVAS